MNEHDRNTINGLSKWLTVSRTIVDTKRIEVETGYEGYWDIQPQYENVPVYKTNWECPKQARDEALQSLRRIKRHSSDQQVRTAASFEIKKYHINKKEVGEWSAIGIIVGLGALATAGYLIARSLFDF